MTLPDLRMCCFCISLKAGILTWGYINVIYHAVLFIILCSEFKFILIVAMLYIREGNRDPVMDHFFANYVTSLILLFSFTVYNVFLVLASHKNSVKMLNILFKVGALLWIFKFLYCSVYLGYHLMAAIFRDTEHKTDPVTVRLKLFLVLVILEPVLQLYGFLLIRSFMLKIRGENHSVGYININQNFDVEIDREPLIIQPTTPIVKPEPNVESIKMDMSDFY